MHTHTKIEKTLMHFTFQFDITQSSAHKGLCCAQSCLLNSAYCHSFPGKSCCSRFFRCFTTSCLKGGFRVTARPLVFKNIIIITSLNMFVRILITSISTHLCFSLFNTPSTLISGSFVGRERASGTPPLGCSWGDSTPVA